jgi:hypothetical protein
MQGESGSRPGVLEWTVVLVVGVLVVAVVLGLNLIPPLNAGQHVLEAAKPAFATDRLKGDRSGTNFISSDVGTPVSSAPQLRTGSDLIPVLEAQRGNYDRLVTSSRMDFIGDLVLIVGIVVVVYGLLMLYLGRRPRRRARGAAASTPSAEPAAWMGAPRLISFPLTRFDTSEAAGASFRRRRGVALKTSALQFGPCVTLRKGRI